MESLPSPCRAVSPTDAAAVQLRSDEELARRLAMEILSSDDEVQIIEPPEKKCRTVVKTLDPIFTSIESPEEGSISAEAKSKVDALWYSWLRGDEIADLQCNQDFSRFAVHRLLAEFRQAPLATIKKAFQVAFPQDEAAAASKYWICDRCGDANKAIRSSCNNCNASAPKWGPQSTAASKSLREETAWNNDEKDCAVVIVEEQESPADLWICAKCEEPNQARRIVCNSCNHLRPKGKWSCPRCDEPNKGERDQCNNCGWFRRTKEEQEMEQEDIVIGQALALRFKVRAERISALRALGGLGVCGCCFSDDLLPEEELRCNGPKGHGFCISCVKHAALEFFGTGLFTLNLNHDHSSSSSSSSAAPPPTSSRANLSSSLLRCMDMSACPGHFADAALKKALPRKAYIRYSRRSAALQAANSGLPDLVSCPQCDFMIQMGDRHESVVRCLDPECGKVTCRWCRGPYHPGQRCDEVETDAETRIRVFLQEKMTEIRLRRCPNVKCKKPYERTEGCNHIVCPCGTHSCFLCGEELSKIRPYDHYKDGHLGGGTNAAGSRCVVYGTPAWAEKTEAQICNEAEKSLSEFLDRNPELKQAAKRFDATKSTALNELLRPPEASDGSRCPTPFPWNSQDRKTSCLKTTSTL